jgi:hypothetical protein
MGLLNPPAAVSVIARTAQLHRVKLAISGTGPEQGFGCDRSGSAIGGAASFELVEDQRRQLGRNSQ